MYVWLVQQGSEHLQKYIQLCKNNRIIGDLLAAFEIRQILYMSITFTKL